MRLLYLVARLRVDHLEMNPHEPEALFPDRTIEVPRGRFRCRPKRYTCLVKTAARRAGVMPLSRQGDEARRLQRGSDNPIP